MAKVKRMKLEDPDAPLPPAPIAHTHAHQVVSRTLPHSLEAEENLLSCCLLDGGGVMAKCQEARIEPASFYDTKHGIIYGHLLSLHARQAPLEPSVLAEELKGARQLDAVGGYAFLMRISGLVPTTIQAGYFIERVREQSILRNLIRASTGVVENCYNFSGDIETFLVEQTARVNLSVNGYAARSVLPSRGLFDFPLPQDGDKSILIGNRYLNRGDGAVIVSTSGMGKSAIALQMAAELALAKGPFGIHGNGPLSSLIVQSEDSEGDIAEVAFSIRHVLGLNDAEVAKVSSMVRVVTDRVNRGQKFIDALRLLIREHKPDLVFINPLQAFIEGDVTEASDLSRFLREGLNSLNEPATFAYVVIHHTTKPSTGKERGDRLWHEVMYDMAGGAEIINWARAILSLRAAPTEGHFNLVLAKRGRRAGVTREVPQGTGFRLEPVTTIPLKHATGHLDVPGMKRGLPLIFWEPREPDADAPRGPIAKGGGRPSQHSFDDYKNLFPPKSGTGLELGPLHTLLRTNRDISKSSLFTCLTRWIEQGFVELLAPPGKPTRYRAAF